MMMMMMGIKNGLSVLSSSQKQASSKLPLLAMERLVLSDHVGGVCSPPAAAAAAMGSSRRFFHAGGGGGGGGGAGGGGGGAGAGASLVKRDIFRTGVCSPPPPAAAAAAAAMGSSRRFFHAGGGGGASLVKRDMVRAGGNTPFLFSGWKTRECAGGFVPHQCNISHMLPYFARALASSSTSQSSIPRQEPTKTTKKECQIISSSILQRETDDEISNSTKVSLNQFPGLMAPHRPQVGLTPSEITRRSKTRCLLRLNPSTGYFEEQQDVAAAANHHTHDKLQVPYGHVCCGSAYGWLFLIDDNLDMKLLNPFSGAEIQLPPGKTLPPSISDEYDRWLLSKWFVRKAIFSANPSVEPRPVVLVIHGAQLMAFCKPGDEGWTPLEFPAEGNFHQDAIYHKGLFYVLSYPGYVAAYDIGRRIDDDDHSVKITLVATPPKKGWIYSYDSYLVVVDGELVRVELVQRCFRDCCIDRNLRLIEKERARDGDTTDEEKDPDEDDEEIDSDTITCVYQKLSSVTYRIKLRQLDVSEKQWVKMESLGDKAVFVGYNTGFALTASDYPAGVCIPDSVYFTPGDCGNELACYDAGIFNVKDKSVKPLYPPLPIDGVIRPPPTWIVNASCC